jgi:hypothetical protein
MFHTVDILSKLRAQGAPAQFLKIAEENLVLQVLETSQPYLLIGLDEVRTSDSGALHQGNRNYYVHAVESRAMIRLIVAFVLLTCLSGCAFFERLGMAARPGKTAENPPWIYKGNGARERSPNARDVF